jgi:hypothetical protein
MKLQFYCSFVRVWILVSCPKRWTDYGYLRTNCREEYFDLQRWKQQGIKIMACWGASLTSSSANISGSNKPRRLGWPQYDFKFPHILYGKNHFRYLGVFWITISKLIRNRIRWGVKWVPLARDLIADSFDYINKHSSSILHRISNNQRLNDLVP